MSDIASIIDHTLLDPAAPLGRYTELCREAITYKFASVCVNSTFVPLIYNILKQHPEAGVKTCSVVGFPFGSASLGAKIAETNQIIIDGCHELDLVVPIYSIKSHDWHHVRNEIKSIRDEAPGHILKVILEVGLLTDDEIKYTTDICIEQNCDFVKTSTGVNIKLPIEKTAKYVLTLKNFVKGTSVKVKASGGIRSLADVRMVLDAGADRVGTSNAVGIMQELQNENGTV
jgi:deoxyribose-phosphate aldolase